MYFIKGIKGPKQIYLDNTERYYVNLVFSLNFEIVFTLQIKISKCRYPIQISTFELGEQTPKVNAELINTVSAQLTKGRWPFL